MPSDSEPAAAASISRREFLCGAPNCSNVVPGIYCDPCRASLVARKMERSEQVAKERSERMKALHEKRRQDEQAGD